MWLCPSMGLRASGKLRSPHGCVSSCWTLAAPLHAPLPVCTLPLSLPGGSLDRQPLGRNVASRSRTQDPKCHVTSSERGGPSVALIPTPQCLPAAGEAQATLCGAGRGSGRPQRNRAFSEEYLPPAITGLKGNRMWREYRAF